MARPVSAATEEPDPEPEDDDAAAVGDVPPTEPSRADATEARVAVAAWVETLTAEERDAIAADPDASDGPFRDWLAERVSSEEADRTLNAARWLAEQPASLMEAAGKPFPERAYAADILEDPAGYGLDGREAAEEWLLWAAVAPQAEWEEACRESGSDPATTVRPGRNALPPYLQMRLAAQNLERRAEETLPDGRPKYL